MKTKTQKVQNIVVLWKNATTAVGREEQPSPVERAEIAERVKGLITPELLGFGDEGDAPVDEDDGMAEEDLRVTTEARVSLFREKLVCGLAELGEDELAASLIAGLHDEEAREDLRLVLVKSVTEYGRYDAARILADRFFQEYPSRLLGLRAELFRLDAKPGELPDLRKLTERVVMEGTTFPPSAVAATLTLWSLSNERVDLEHARELCREIKHPMLRGIAYKLVAAKTGLVEDYLDGFRHALRTRGRSGIQSAEKMFGAVTWARICDVHKEFGTLGFKETAPMSRKTLNALLEELKSISPAWENFLRQRLQKTELL